MSDKFKSVSLRFIKAFVSGALASATVVLGTLNITGTVPDILSTTALSLLIGGFTGVLQALEKYANWQDTPTI